MIKMKEHVAEVRDDFDTPINYLMAIPEYADLVYKFGELNTLIEKVSNDLYEEGFKDGYTTGLQEGKGDKAHIIRV